jgi:hypothetical protein
MNFFFKLLNVPCRLKHATIFAVQLLLVMMICVPSAIAQPQYFSTGVQHGTNTYPFQQTDRRTQWLYQAGDWNTTPPAGLIKRIYVMPGASVNNTTFQDFSVSIGQTALTALPLSWMPVTNVLSSGTYTIPTITGNTWLAIDLQTPFAFDPAQNLVIDIRQSAVLSGGFGVNSVNTSVVTRTYGAYADATPPGAGLSLPFLGFDICPTPSITSVSPISAVPGAPINITGTGFSSVVSDNTVWFGGGKATVTAASGTSITATVPSGATYDPVSVSGLPICGLIAHSSQRFLHRDACSTTLSNTSLTRTATYTFANGDVRMPLLADIDNDGKLDLVLTDNTHNLVRVYKNISATGTVNGSSFDTPVSFSILNAAIITITDLDGDGKLDIAVVSGNSGVRIMRNTSTTGVINTSSFTVSANIPNGSTDPWGIAYGDIDGDGKPDIITTNRSSASISVLRNTSTAGNVSLAAPVIYPLTGTIIRRIAVGDLDGDEKPEIAVVSQNGNVNVFRNTSTPGVINAASLAAPTSIPTSGGLSINLADMNSDGKLDLIMGNAAGNGFSIWRNNSTVGTLSFGGVQSTSYAASIYALSIADMNGDGMPDVITGNRNMSNISIHPNTSSAGTISLMEMAIKIL